ncbi:hypothetical protein [Paenirhodobacter sp. CAU 1674]|uniref:hypothetical protein n=1 Tax=Paenirhodobacter sp. CAU 1674 TaxID=3032596 RepID=UPI0023DA9E3C|nr:hypothetical protein [Paenirhodobacter sp. CAU 1674]MDF2142930.1 hypothetical protein [Paenirhodobacter sp. CAU 1674]
MRKFLSCVLLAVTPAMAGAQSLSLADLQKQIDAEVNKGSEYVVLLNDPDPKRAQAAMKVMLGSGDPDLISIALDHGLYSADSAVRGLALKGLLDTKPRLDVFVTMTDPDDDLRNSIGKMFSTVPNPEGVATVPILVTGYDAKLDCYTAEFSMANENKCFIQVRPEAIRARLGYAWTELRLNDDGGLVGEIKLYSGPLTPVRIQLR